ncbi:MAG: hypothetical protein VW258_12320 [Thalassolituus sp.]
MKKLAITALSAALLSGCFGEDESNTNSVTGHVYIAQLIAADYSSSEIAVGTVGEADAIEGYAVKDDSDYTIDVYGQYLYHIGKNNLDTLTRYDSAADFLQADYTYNLAEPESASSNTYKLVQVAQDKAYLIRYGKASVQIIDPTADEDNFVKGSIDLSAYNAEGASVPYMADAVFTDGKLFVGMQRLASNYQVVTDSYIAVIDTTTDTEIDTSAAEGLNGLALSADNLSGMTATDDFLYVTGRGDYGNNSGALDRINLDDYSVETLIDGSTFSSLNDADNNTYYHVEAVTVVDDLGYVKLSVEQGYSALENPIYSFPVDTNIFTELSVEEFTDQKIGVMTAGPDSTLWVGVRNEEATDMYVMNSDGTIQETAIEFSMPVNELEFMEVQE